MQSGFSVQSCQAYRLPWDSTVTESGMYRHTYTMVSGCDSVVTATVVVHPNVTGQEHRVICANQLPMQWNGQNLTAPGRYTALLKSAVRCDSTAILTLEVSNQASSETNVKACEMYMLPWGGNPVKISGDYAYTYQTTTGCDSIVTVHLVITKGSHTDTTAVACNTFTWNRNGVTYRQSGTYESIFTNTNGCQDTVRLKLTLSEAVQSQFTEVACKSYRLPWDSAVTQSGAYQHTYSTVNGCDSVVTARITINQGVRTDTTAVACQSFTWSRDGMTYTESGTYDYFTTNANGCQDTMRLQLAISKLIVIADAPDLACGQTTGTITVNAAGGTAPYQYSLNGTSYQSSNQFTGVSAGSYTVTVKDAIGCTGQTSVSFKPTPDAMIVGGITICAGASATLNITLSGTAPFTLVYKDGAGTHTLSGITTSPYQLTVTPSSTTTYSIVSVMDAKCTNTSINSAATVTVQSPGSGVRYPTITTQPNVATQLQARDLGSGYTYLWNPPTGLNFTNVRTPVFKHDKEMEYTIRITSGLGCVVVDTLMVIMHEQTPTTIRSDIFVPKAWSPNSDGHNDKLFPLTVKIKQLYYFRIFNRWGQLLFETNVIGQGWDGMYKARPQVTDVYTWTLEAIGEDGVHYKRAGNSVLLR